MSSCIISPHVGKSHCVCRSVCASHSCTFLYACSLALRDRSAWTGVRVCVRVNGVRCYLGADGAEDRGRRGRREGRDCHLVYSVLISAERERKRETHQCSMSCNTITREEAGKTNFLISEELIGVYYSCRASPPERFSHRAAGCNGYAVQTHFQLQ